MKPREFAFWLQGYFEINGTKDALDARQAKVVLDKIEKTDVTSSDPTDQKAAAYVNYAKGALNSIQFVSAEDQPKVLQGITNKLRADLNDLFLHAIDPSVPGDQQQHRRAHRPGGNGGVEIMC